MSETRFGKPKPRKTKCKWEEGCFMRIPRISRLTPPAFGCRFAALSELWALDFGLRRGIISASAEYAVRR
jgi:hypothetical protein